MKTIPCHKCNLNGETSEVCRCDEGSNSLLIDGLACCPFCGGEVELVDKDGTWIIECETCHLVMNCFSKPTLVYRWNFRAG
jgi:hypothetical protein